MSSLVRQDVLPIAVGYLLVMAALAVGLRLSRRLAGPRGPGGPGGPDGRQEAPGLRAVPGREVAGPLEATGPGMAGPGRPAAAWLRLARHYAGTAIGGYLLLMAVVIVYYYGVTRVGGAFIESSFTGCALLIALSTPVFALASWLTARHRDRAARHRDRPPRSPADPPPLRP